MSVGNFVINVINMIIFIMNFVSLTRSPNRSIFHMVRMTKSDHHDPSPHPILIKCSAVGELGSNSKCVELRWPDRAYAPVSPACLPPQIQIDSNTNTTNCRDEISKSLETNQQKTYSMINTFTKKKCTVNALNMANASNMHHGVATEKQLVLTSLLAVRES